MANVELLPGGGEGREEGTGDRKLLVLAERLMREPEVVAWLGADPKPAPWTDDDRPAAA
jgi:hypothetical protein